MKWFKKIAKIAGIFFLVVFLAVSVAFVYVSRTPSVIINTKNALWATEYLAKQGFKLEWDKLDVTATSQSFWDKRVKITSQKACFDEGEVKGCFVSTYFNLVLELRPWKPRLRVVQLKLNEGELSYIPVAAPPQKNLASEDNGQILPSLPKELSYVVVDNLFIGLDKILLNLGPAPLKGRAKLEAKLSENQDLQYVLDLNLAEKKRSIVGNLKGTIVGKELKGVISANLKNVAEGVPTIELAQCQVGFKEEKNKPRENISIACPFEFTGSFPRFKNGPKEKIINKTKMNLVADFAIQTPPRKSSSITGKVKLEFDSLFKGMNDGKGAITTDVSGLLSDFPRNLNLNSQVHLEISQFQNVVNMFRDYPWAIPSPFNTLAGNIVLDISGKGKLAQEGWVCPVVLKTQLASTDQVMNLDGLGEFRIQSEPQWKAHLAITIALSDVQLTLPELNLKAPGSLFPDPRIKGQSPSRAPANTPPSFSYQIDVLTPDQKPMRLSSHLAKDKVPLEARISINDTKGVSGKIELLPFPIELFKRKATVKHLAVKLTDDPEKTEVNGEVEVVYTDYTVDVLILGLLKEPQIRFVSNPPLPEDKVIAVLLFGKTPDELDDSQSASVGGTQSALADRAISLVSMYILASTPVESVGYDPATKVFNAKVHLADGTSLNIGSNMKALNQIGIRKQLGNHWAIVSYLENPLDPVHRTLTAFLEWSKGY